MTLTLKDDTELSCLPARVCTGESSGWLLTWPLFLVPTGGCSSFSGPWRLPGRMACLQPKPAGSAWRRATRATTLSACTPARPQWRTFGKTSTVSSQAHGPCANQGISVPQFPGTMGVDKDALSTCSAWYRKEEREAWGQVGLVQHWPRKEVSVPCPVSLGFRASSMKWGRD